MTNPIEAVSRLRCETETPAHSALVSNRRTFVMNTVVSVASLASASAVASPAMSEPASQDPIIAAIERHREALLHYLAANRAYGHHVDNGSDEMDAIEAAFDAAFEAKDAAATDLIEIIPTTLAGAAALLDYIVKIATGRIVLSDDPEGRYRSAIFCLPQDPSPADGHSLFPFDVMANARQAMIELGVA